jgi:hypothetical protein
MSGTLAVLLRLRFPALWDDDVGDDMAGGRAGTEGYLVS